MSPSRSSSRALFPFTAIVAQDELKLALQIAVVDPNIGGVLVFGDRGTGKSTAVRALATLLPRMRVIAGCPYQCDPATNGDGTQCVAGCAVLASGHARSVVDVPVPVVDLPLGATEDRVVGALDLETALTRGERAFSPGLLARAHRGFLYIDEVNLLPDHLVDLLLDVAASGENVVEREGLSVRHPAKFVLIGSGNPEEGELRPQLLDRFGLSLEVKTPQDIATRIEVVKRRVAFDLDARAFVETYAPAEAALTRQLEDARTRLREVVVEERVVERAATLCQSLGTDGLRGELTLIRAARAAASLDGDTAVEDRHLQRVAALALRHRLRRNPLDEVGSTVRVEKAVAQVFAA
jgi:magnesium chelatase subunit I